MSNGNMVVVVRIHIEVYNKKTTQRATQLGGLWERHEFGKYLIKKKKQKSKSKDLIFEFGSGKKFLFKLISTVCSLFTLLKT